MNYGRRGVRAKQKALNSKTIKWERKLILSLFELVLIAMVGLGICGVAAGIGAFKGILSSTPSIHFNDIVASGQATIVYDMEGNEIDQYVNTDSNRIRVEMAAIPEHLGQAFIALEDRRFYQHNGIDFKGMIRAGYTFLQTGGNRAEGASTITQQLLKNTVFTEWMEEGDNMIKKIKRKIQEQFLAIEISKVYSKDQILLEYMNAINLGQNTLGVESASQRYFGKTCSELTLSECAVIASITQNPSRYNPISHPDRNRDRRQKCLDDMLELEFITQAEYDEAIADTDAVYERIGLFDTDYRLNSNATAGSYFSDAVYEQVKEDLINIAGYSESMTERLLTAGGLRIYSTMDPTIQAIADEEFANPDNFPPNVKWYLSYALTIRDADDTAHNFSKENMMTWFKANVDKKFNLIFSSQDEAYEAIEAYRTAMLAELGVADDEDNYDESVSMTAQPQAAFVIEDQETGYVVALVGGRGAKEGRRTLNRATSAMRSPGSTFKVLASFAPALDSAGKTLATVYNDAPFNYDDGKPVSNWYKTGYRGIQSIREATRESLNIIAVKNLTVITPQLGYDYLLNFGFTTVTDHYVASNGDILSDVNQSLALGGLTLGVTPYELNAGYATIANMGTYVEPKLYTKVTDSEGNVILDNTTPTTRQVIKETTAFLLTDAMVDVVKNGGTGARCNFSQSMAIAGKTGTSTDTHDVWFCGYTPYYTASVWTGYDNNIGMSTSKANDESAVSKVLWRAIMQRVHENLPPESFTRPAEGIVQVDICTQSGQLPVPGLCDGCIRSELFAEGTEPTTTCTIHYQGDICAYQGIPASPECPFKYTGVATFPLAEDPALINGSTTIIENPDGTQTVNTPSRTSERCQHDAAFYANPEWESIIAAQQWELEQRGWTAQSEEDDWEEDE
ncbi:MAG: transglycosylase domain-containing protein [Eubacterium sp.]|nr:transglycosylase domain-containing protein [Eubacterium sp.]